MLGESAGHSEERALHDVLAATNTAARPRSEWAPPAPGEYDYGGGGGTDYDTPSRPTRAVVGGACRAQLREHRRANESCRHLDGRRPSTGLLIGETRNSNGVYYDEFRLGGTSLSSPLFGRRRRRRLGGRTIARLREPLLYKLPV